MGFSDFLKETHLLLTMFQLIWNQGEVLDVKALAMGNHLCSPSLNRYSVFLTGFLFVSVFVSYRRIATKSNSIIMGLRQVDMHCENKYDLPSISRYKTVVN